MCKFFNRVLVPALVKVFGNSIEDTFSTVSVGEQVHRPGPPTDLSKGAFKDVGGTNRLPH